MPGHWCDVCWKRIDKDAVYRCPKCDYDVCPKCWDKEQKAKLAKREEANQGDVTVIEYFQRLFGLYRRHWMELAAALFVVFLISLISIKLPSSRGQLFDDIFAMDLDLFYRGLSVYITLTVAQGLLGAVKNVLNQWVEEEILHEVQKSLYERILKQDMANYDNSSDAVMTKRLNHGLRETLSPFLSLTQQSISNTISLIGSFYFCWYYSYRLLLLALSTLGPMTYLAILFVCYLVTL